MVITVLGSYPQHEGDKLKVHTLFTRTMNQPLKQSIVKTVFGASM